ncbi:MAG TPA: hypothetical protein DDW49_05660 [Deltaproteobacteria bacterium]|nr:MAG: hypothetical protein A2048_05010 [Deltaproteobacteria bacterium GWA2_45_12]HBF12860.1 hypothetical protein [Deltaproteobacteria bacterium]
MKKNKKKKYGPAPAHIAKELKHSVEIADFLPSPDHIASMIQKAEVVPVTMNVKKKTIEKYKTFAEKRGIKYQVFVSTLLDTYAQRF